MSRMSRIRRHKPSAPDLNITAFLNLMVILVPFLLITAVFSHMTILELNLPPKQDNNHQNDDKKKDRNFEVIIRKDKLILSDTLGGPIKAFPKVKGQYDMKGLSKLLMEVKKKFPKKQNITILLEPNIPYDVLVQAMDTVRIVDVVEINSVVKKELFPQIAIGDAPPAKGS
jgi:biopolymer transport protein ExbD